ncbi:hypothetical protein [Kocuria palustris]|uniref:hypothetical protein n=1 Tax=Kocuria palustris TaxID=71999 RepID=UPI00331DF71E
MSLALHPGLPDAMLARLAPEPIAAQPEPDSDDTAATTDLCLNCALEPGDETGMAQSITEISRQDTMTRIRLSCGHQIISWI